MAESMLHGKGKSPIVQATDKDSGLEPTVSKHITAEKACPSKPVSKKVEKGPEKDKHDKNPNKEILLILRELNNNVNKQSDKLQKLNERVDTLYDMCDYDQNVQYEDDYCQDASQTEQFEEEKENEQDSAASASLSDNSGPTSWFKGLSDKFLTAEKVDNEVHDDLASFVNMSFRNGVSEDRVAEICKDIHRPSNCDALIKTRVNPGMWRLLKPQTQTEDAKMQAIQNFVIKASVNIVKLLDKESTGLDSQSLEWGTNALALLGQANKFMNNKRKESHRFDLDPKFYPLTSPGLPFTEYLYGNETDINKNVRDIQDMSRIGKIGRSSRGRGYRMAPYRRGSRGFRRGFRGRGFNNYPMKGDGSGSVPKNQKEGQKK